VSNEELVAAFPLGKEFMLFRLPDATDGWRRNIE